MGLKLSLAVTWKLLFEYVTEWLSLEHNAFYWKDVSVLVLQFFLLHNAQVLPAVYYKVIH